MGKKEKSSNKNIFVLFLILILLTPLGLLTQNPAFGEWTLDEIKQKIGFIPKGLEKYSEIWRFDLFDGYSVKYLHNDYIGYILSAVIGIVVIFGLFYLLRVFINERK